MEKACNGVAPPPGHLPPCGDAITSSFRKDMLDICPGACGPQKHFLPWGDMTSALSQTGEFARLQVSEAGIWCVDPASGEGAPPGANSSAQCECPPLPRRPSPALATRAGCGVVKGGSMSQLCSVQSYGRL